MGKKSRKRREEREKKGGNGAMGIKVEKRCGKGEKRGEKVKKG